MLVGIHLCWQSNNSTSIILLVFVCDDVFLQTCCSGVIVNGYTGSTSLEPFKLCSSLLSSRSWNVGWRSCCVVVAGVPPESVQPKLSLVELDNWQNVSFCLFEASCRINHFQCVDQCLLVDETVHQGTWNIWDTSSYLFPTCWMLCYQ